MKSSWDDDKIDQIRMIGEDLIRQGERILGMCEGHKVKQEDDDGDESSESSDKKVSTMIAFLKPKKK